MSTKGFTIIESLVAITLLMTAIVAPLTISYQGIAATTLARDQMVAQYLAQDAADYVFARKISNIIRIEGGEPDLTWDDGFDNCIASDCVVDTTDTDMTGDINDACGVSCPLRYNSTTGRYNYSSGAGTANSKFTRTISMDRNGADEIKVTITVGWTTSFGTPSVTLPLNLFNY